MAGNVGSANGCIRNAIVGWLGMSGPQTVALGMLAYNVIPIFVAPFFGLEMETLDLGIDQ